MLNLNCVICAELFKQSDEVYVTPCGHMFHYGCLVQWLERSKTCPQCRNKCTMRNIWRVYFNLANLDASHIDVGSLQDQLDNVNLTLKLKETECRKTEEQMKELKETQKKCLKTISGLEQKLLSKETILNIYTEQINLLKREAKVCEDLRKENKSLKHKIYKMESMTAILEADAKETERLVKYETSTDVLSTWVSTLKRELRQCESKKIELRNIMQVVQNDYRREVDLKRKLEDRVSQLESELYQAQEKMKSMEEQEPTKRSTARNTTTLDDNHIVGLKNEDRRNTISPLTKENIKRIEQSNSPYFNIKSSSVGVSSLLVPTKSNELMNLSPIKACQSGITMAGSAIRKTSSNLSEKYSIFKKPRLALVGSSNSTSTTKHLGPNITYNGFGGTVKIDPFAQRAEEETIPTTSKPVAKNINERLKAGTLRNFKSTK